MRSDERLGFRIVSQLVGGSPRTLARFECVGCGAELDVAVTSGKSLNPEGTAKNAKQKGWNVDAWRRASTHCPTCAGRKRVRDNMSAEPGKVIHMAAPITLSPASSATPDQKQRIRSYLDKHFDDGVGVYLDEMSDERIAELVGVPRLAVSTLRETAYGPVRVSPEVAALRAEISALRGEVEAAKKSLEKMAEKLAGCASKAEKMTATKAA